MRIGILSAFTMVLLASFSNTKPVDLIRNTYKKALKESESVQELKKLTKNKKDAHSIAFYAMALAFEARESSWVPTKMSLAKDAYAQLNKAVQANPNNFEIRYLRFSFSCEVPSMLGLNEHIKDDKKYILEHAKKGEYLADIMKKYFQKSSCLTDKEKQSINTRL
jgi:ferritin